MNSSIEELLLLQIDQKRRQLRERKNKLQNKIKELRKDVSQLEASKDKDISNFRHWERLKTKSSIRLKRLNVAIEELKKRITDIAANVRSIRDGWIATGLENNQRKVYRELDQEEERCDDDQHVTEESKQFWGDIWSLSADHKKDPKWLQDF